ncbi:hypothetical protein U9M48_030217 [Paspalum notatum var. saurae]|uniref:Uncharacterized protein n=1 Tax=Paspalum notatum var. saurae TaxID=547442 RepID=A0AAQ3X328_PASNO
MRAVVPASAPRLAGTRLLLLQNPAAGPELRLLLLYWGLLLRLIHDPSSALPASFAAGLVQDPPTAPRTSSSGFWAAAAAPHPVSPSP